MTFYAKQLTLAQNISDIEQRAKAINDTMFTVSNAIHQFEYVLRNSGYYSLSQKWNRASGVLASVVKLHAHGTASEDELAAANAVEAFTGEAFKSHAKAQQSLKTYFKKEFASDWAPRSAASSKVVVNAADAFMDKLTS